ncbi:MAG: helix-turn-helix domain-containing protein [Patescibacteria group bacterium]
MDLIVTTPDQLRAIIREEIQKATKHHPEPEKDSLLTIEQLCDYLPEHPARQTIYCKVNDRLIPYEKHGKRLYFRKSTINFWLSNGRQVQTNLSK